MYKWVSLILHVPIERIRTTQLLSDRIEDGETYEGTLGQMGMDNSLHYYLDCYVADHYGQSSVLWR
ncbi:hypothetical protein AGR7A_Cc140017 [Agrobacterium deltaense NCPPB 1641]|uniref:Uncharacterized protein n=1 Tax=Agrobacterium deltaense NCPPB 1641 TaxID=1183425 RepID=A0A1S7TK52_9HYPH|nr:hypothetical protein AGR7A_Cc140017 [Agrobacterium deltaense NCPPB 1641]